MRTFSEKPAKLKGIAWLLFAGTATFSAFFLPVLLYTWLHDKFLDFNGATPTRIVIQIIFSFLIIFSALYHSFYRVKTIALDLGLGRYEKIITILIWLIFLALLAALIYTFFIYLAFTVGMH